MDNRRFLTGQQPEPVSFMPLEIEIKENWENELFWDVSEKNVEKNSGVRTSEVREEE